MPRKRARQSHNKWWWAAAAAVAVVGRFAARKTSTSGWRGDDGAADLLRGLPPNGCDVDAAAAISLRDFEAEYRGKKPLLLRGAAAHWPALEKWTRPYLLEHFGDRAANVGTGSDIIYAGGGAANHATLRDLLRNMRNGSDAVAFDARLLGTLPELARDFAAPPVLGRAFPAAASYGLLSLGPSRSGLPPHAHGEAWLGLVAGRKRWFLRAPGAAIDEEGAVHPLASIRAWTAILRGGCLQAPGDVLYVPRGWTHATLNVGEALAVGAQAQWPAADRLARARAVLARAPDDVRALHSAGVAAAHLGRFDESVAALGRAVALTRCLQPEVAVLLAEALHAAGRPEEASETIERCRGAHAAERAAPKRAHPPSSEALAAAHLKFARFYLGADAFDAALGPLGDALQLRPAYAEALLERAYALQRLGDAPGARADLLAADALAPGDVRVARALRALG